MREDSRGKKKKGEAPYGNLTLTDYDKRYQRRKEFLRELIKNEREIDILVAAVLARYVLLLNQYANAEGRIQIVNLLSLRLAAEMEVKLLAQRILGITESSMVRAVELGQLTILDSIKKQISKRAYNELIRRGVRQKPPAIIAADLIQSGYDDVPLSDKLNFAASKAVFDINKNIASGVVNQEPVSKVASNVSANLTGDVIIAGAAGAVVAVGSGAYRSFFANVARAVRTEMAHAYSEAVSSLGEETEWIEGYEFNLSASHAVVDICDEHAGQILSKDDFDDFPPLHENCRCFLSPVVDQKKLLDFLGLR